MSTRKTCLAGTILFLFGGMITTEAGASMIAYWSFNNGFNGLSASPSMVHNADIGTAELFQQRSALDMDGVDGTSHTTMSGQSFPAGQAIAWDEVNGVSEDRGEILISFSTIGMEDIEMGFDILGNSNPQILAADLDYDLLGLVEISNPQNPTGPMLKAFASAGTTRHDNLTVGANASGYSRVTIPLSDVAAIDNESVVVFRLNDFNFGGSLAIDNLEITGVEIVPEPHNLGILWLGSFVWLLMKRQRPIQGWWRRF
jgi:hypothetical protein